MKKIKKTKHLIKTWNKYLLSESIKLDDHYEDREDYEDSGFQIEDEENFLDVAVSDRKETGLHGGYDEEKMQRLSSFDASGINVGIKSIIDKLEDIHPMKQVAYASVIQVAVLFGMLGCMSINQVLFV